MPIVLEGQTNDFTRVVTGLFSFDHLMANHRGEIGLPGNTITELYGPPGLGKSTIATYLAGRYSYLTGGTRIEVADLEAAYETHYVIRNLNNTGFDGVLHFTETVDKKNKPRSHEDMLDEIVSMLRDESVSAIVIDSVGAIAPTAEMNNPIGSANMGRRGQVMAQTSRKLMYMLRIVERPKIAILVNHQYDALGKIGQRVTPGGMAKSYAAANRLTIYAKERFDYGDVHIALRTDKLRIGGVKKEARGYVYLIPGYGVSPEMTAVFDCIVAGHADRTSRGIRMNGLNYGYLRNMRDQVINGEAKWVQDFNDALNKGGFTDSTEDEDETTTEEPNE